MAIKRKLSFLCILSRKFLYSILISLVVSSEDIKARCTTTNLKGKYSFQRAIALIERGWSVVGGLRGAERYVVGGKRHVLPWKQPKWCIDRKTSHSWASRRQYFCPSLFRFQDYITYSTITFYIPSCFSLHYFSGLVACCYSKLFPAVEGDNQVVWRRAHADSGPVMERKLC